MLSDLLARNQVATITLAQTTYLHVQIGADTFRLGFKEKSEAYLKPGKQGLVNTYAYHPLLLKYNEPKETVYISPRPNDPNSLFQKIQQIVDSAYQGWRDWRSVLFLRNKEMAAKLLQQNLQDGYGMLLEGAPESIAKAVIGACKQHEAKTSVPVPDYVNPNLFINYHLLTIGPCYVIAKEFTCHLL